MSATSELLGDVDCSLQKADLLGANVRVLRQMLDYGGFAS